MSVADTIREKLTAAFAPKELIVEDESAKHAGHSGARPGGETHFNVRIVSETFEGISRVERQRRVYAALADEMKLAFAEVFEVATFYAHFDVVKEGAPDIAPVTIRVCDSLTCAMLGAESLLKELQK